ncbi:DUF2158 domain-containing protein [Bradyrhizobium sp. 4]|nr:DUF2158 domain-containing protein [Bradyrhizobium sp. 39]MCK1752933.1 DUF2158 domain-containing protein [Bradyrhizobium sp. 135]UPJ37124.1 DUF2158 domain-containing protein [Bradyrhizobium sp. 4]
MFKLGDFVRHKSGGPIMVVDQEVFRSSIEPTIRCAWIEAGKRHHASFKEGELQPVHGDGTPRGYRAED